MLFISVTPDVHDVVSSASLTAPTSATRPVRSRFVYVTPFTTPVSPTATLAQRTVTPLAAMPNRRQLAGRTGLGSAQVTLEAASKLLQAEPTLATFQDDRSLLKAVAPLNMLLMVVTELVTQLPMSWLKAEAYYITATGGWPRGVSVNASRGRAREKK